MSQPNKKITKARIEGIKNADLEVFKNSLIPFNATVEKYKDKEEAAIVIFKAPIEKKHLDGIGNYIIKPMEFEEESSDQNLRKRNTNFICDRIVVDEHDIIKFFLNITLIAPVIFVLLSLLIFFAIF
ncbi:conserved Plasmodium protein, unknown function [Plasmodium knowlesi strain H]|uniref:Uncharacterized protein n=3 Tax=Plasmodium knowlesi TaxID=5850 RepID=A0A5K1VG89_PLAKH|nr:conserved Plasmodium protein, unknown function [Plasmodium knowlesi strain H]OTN65767.1 Uncharacterized protein PKNOH_S100029500 [Plasmodium knowlesi]CAA9987660.1 conserved Plasmodium protein, unknown function [Plasmodium knowlesi strain H]SBO26873.1 conserved Plasmodium protein, unknown function [Plasmodium knowlesi strain H]SBO29662.1 conserved Plasmodium protein, unknown function [Plasmodium knowlesi strain H]VVS77134.1 conserved Plasmodium protein, unknown function [Plasmodium knowlesi |eukprot:XP_002258658.1 hypothetical protein, conserved in Plasmodium species [Plasmodium knowlesi strain H]